MTRRTGLLIGWRRRARARHQGPGGQDDIGVMNMVIGAAHTGCRCHVRNQRAGLH